MIADKYKTGRKRLWAAIIDGIVFLPFVLVQQWIVTDQQSETVIMGWIIFLTLLSIFYPVILHHRYGQTIGKMAMGIKVVDLSEVKNISLWQSVKRDAVYILIEAVFFVVFFAGSFTPANYMEFYDDYAAIPQLLWVILELVTMFTNNKRRALHDYMAHSVVVIK